VIEMVDDCIDVRSFLAAFSGIRAGIPRLPPLDLASADLQVTHHAPITMPWRAGLFYRDYPVASNHQL
jgi:hypothetical protein